MHFCFTPTWIPTHWPCNVLYPKKHLDIYIFYNRITVKRNRICFDIINTCLFYVAQNTFTARESWQTCPSLPRRRVRQNWDHCLWDSGLSKFMQRLYKRIRYSNILWCLNDLDNTNMGNIGFLWAVKLNYKVPFTFESTKSIVWTHINVTKVI